MLNQPNNNFDKNFFIKFMLFMLLAMLVFHFFMPKNKSEDLIKKTEPVQVQELKKENRTPVSKQDFENKKYLGTVSRYSNSFEISSLYLKGFLNSEGKDVQLLNDKNNISFSYDCAFSCPDFTYFNKEKNRYTSNSNNVYYEIIFEANDDYSLVIKQTYKNKTNKPVKISPQISMNNSDDSKDGAFVYSGAISYIDGSISYLDEKKETKKYNTDSGYFGYTQRYYADIMLVKQSQNITFEKEGAVQKFISSEILTVNPGQTITVSQPFFMGPKETKILSAIEKNYDVKRLDLTIDYGTFHVIAKPIGDLLNWLYSITGNMGFAIILLTIIVRILLFPLAQKSFKSTLAMKKIAPQVKAIQNIYKEDKMKQSAEIMKLYKTNKVSPAAGCLPLLLQIPVFFALYRLLLVDFNVLGSSFLWLKDLSLSDPTSIFNLFGLLPYTLPSFIPHIGILPILMGLTMWGQQKIQGGDMGQVPLMKYMPLLFVALFSNIAAGLILYWTISNMFAIMQMYLLERSNASK